MANIVIAGPIPYFKAKLEKAVIDAEVVPVALESAGEALTIPAGSTLSEALQIIIDAVDPA